MVFHHLGRFSWILFLLALFFPHSWDGNRAIAAVDLKKSSQYDETLTMDVWEPYAPDFAVKEFKSYIKNKYNKNIDVIVRYVFSPNEFFDQVRANKTDIISPSHNLIKDERYDFIDKNLIIPINRKKLPNLAGVDTHFLTNEFVTNKNKLYGVPFATGAYSLLYKKSAFLKDPPTSWNALWGRDLRSKYSLSQEFYESNIYITALAMGISPQHMADVGSLNSHAFREKLKDLLRNATFWQGVPHENDVKHSILTTAWGFSHSVHPDPKKEWLFAYPKEGITVWTDYLAVTRAVKRSPFAETLAFEWLNFTLSQSFQQRVTIELLKCFSAVPGAYASLTNRDLQIDPKEKEFFDRHKIYWPIMSTRNRNGLKMIYDEVVAEIKKEKQLATK